jgi:putative peptidoglycan lipid II flippase
LVPYNIGSGEDMETIRTERLAKAAGMVMVAFVASRVFGLAREMIISLQFGTSRELDTYLAAFRIPDLIFQIVARGALGSAFIPVFTEYLARGKREEAWQVASAVMNLVLLTVSLASAIALVFAPQLVSRIVAPGFSPQEQALTVSLMRIMLVSTIVFGVSGVVMGILNSFQHFTMPAWAPAVYNLSIIGGALFLAPRMGVYGLALGVVVGSALHLLIQVPELLKRGLAYVPVLGLAHPGVREVGRLMLPRMLGMASMQVNFLVNTILASSLAPGSLAALNYAWLLMFFPLGIFAMAIATVAFPTFSEMTAKGELGQLRRALSMTLRFTWWLTVPATVGLFILREPIIRLLLERGRFDTSSTQATAWAMQFYALGLFAYATVEIVTRAYYALHDTLTPVLVGLGTMVLNIVLCLLLVGPLSQGGLALANSLATIVEMVFLIVVLRGRLGSMEVGELWVSLARTTIASALMGLVIVWAMGALGEMPLLLQVSGLIALGGAVFFLLSVAFGSQEVRGLNLFRKA